MHPVVVACTEDEAAKAGPVALRAFEESRAKGWPFLSDVLERLLRDVDEVDRGAATALTQALVKYDRLLGFACGSPDAQARLDALLGLARGETHLEPRLARIDDRIERLGTAYSFPDWLVSLLRDELGDAALEPALARMNGVAPRVVRVNALKTTREECLRALAEEGVDVRPTARAPWGVAIDGRRSPFRTQSFAAGDFEMQDEASQIVAELVAPPPGSRVVDACAGAGGKTLALAAQLRGKGRLLAIDASDVKLATLKRRAARAGASNIRPMTADLLAQDEGLAAFEGQAARVLLDAPCSGLGALRRNPEARWRLRPDDLPRLARAQQELARAAARWVSPGGRLVYAVCSFLPSEGERAVQEFVGRKGWVAVTARDVLGRARTEGLTDDAGRCLRTWRFDGRPDGGDDGMDGFFAAVFRRAR
ncbi:MAG TPA: RsmB/NOP family class I SAM-dependent RNA methyltransferase [Polyangiaceae bacterium]|nr:RsmB/NOP family class I SAM-dependent RNA methyltransferase [Polyangiaceae bacterium]